MFTKRFVASVFVLAVAVPSGTGAIWAVQAQNSGTANQDERVYESKDGVELPTVLTEIKPSYTPQAMDARIEGTMQVSAVVKADGSVGEVRVTRSLDQTYGLDEQGVMAARQWRFRPGTKDGKAVSVRIQLQFNFTLK